MARRGRGRQSFQKTSPPTNGSLRVGPQWDPFTCTPDMGPSSRDLMNAILPHADREGADINILAYGTAVDEDEDISETVSEDDDGPPPAKRRRDALTLPAIPWGLLFCRDIQSLALPKREISSARRRSSIFFKVAPNNIANLIVSAAICAPVHSARIPNKQRRTGTITPVDEEHQVDAIFRLSLLSASVYALDQPQLHDGGQFISGEQTVNGDDCRISLEIGGQLECISYLE